MSLKAQTVAIDDEKTKDLAYQATVYDKYVQLGKDTAQAEADSTVALKALDEVDQLYANLLNLQLEIEKKFEDDPLAVIKQEVQAGGDAKEIALFNRLESVIDAVDKQHTNLLATVWKPGLLAIREKFKPLP